MKKVFGILAMMLAMMPAWAQEDPEYKMEIGGGAGLVGYLGDFNGNLTKHLQPSATLLWRRVVSPYMAFKVDASYGKLKGTSKDVETFYPDYADNVYEFSNDMVDMNATYEYNFWPYGTGRDYRGAKRLTPFVFGGLGMTYVKGDKSVFTANVPLGLGIKYKVADRMNLGVEWAIHFSLSDKLDNIQDPYYVKSTGAFKNADAYSSLRVTLTYSFMEKCRVCHNEYE